MRIVIGEDSVLFREGLAALLQCAGHEIVGRTSTAAAAVSAVRVHDPDAVVLDIRMPEAYEGITAALEIRAWTPSMPIMLLSQHIEIRHTLELVSTGAIGYLLKDRVLDVDEFLSALARIASGGTALDSEVVARLVGAAHTKSVLENLTRRELEVLSVMAQGWSNAAIARRLVLSERTVETHCGSIFTKLRLSECVDENRRVRAILTYLDALR